MNPSGDERSVRLTAIGEVAVEAVHELQSVLQIISASAYLARKNPSECIPHLEKIEQNARLAHTIIDDLMALVRETPLAREPVAIAEILLAARTDCPTTSAVWDDAIRPPGLRGSLHPGLIARLIRALYLNAIAVSAPQRPTIRTHAWKEDSLLLIDVADDGPGIVAPLIPHIFEPFVSGRKGGSGLGLALARRIAEAHGGEITLVSSTGGATFRISLPEP